MKRLFLAALLGLALPFAIGACADTLSAIDDPELATTAAKLAKCRGEARAALQASADPKSKQAAEAAFYVYESCKIREGVSGATHDGGAS